MLTTQLSLSQTHHHQPLLGSSALNYVSRSQGITILRTEGGYLDT